MCGLTGFIAKTEANDLPMQDIIAAMTNALVHRGPDDNGVWVDDRRQVALGHTRLAIQDISKNGFQPMDSESLRYSIIFNGEIYNHLDIRKDIAKISENEIFWRGHSDTETLLMAIQLWGFKNTLCKLKGMFSFALFDKQTRKLFLARDSLGEKPLYYGIVNGDFVFGSELKAIKKFPNFANPISRIALSEYLTYGYVPSPFSIYENIHKLKPGYFIEVTILPDHFSLAEPEAFWEIASIISNNQENLFQNDGEAISALETALKSSIQDQMVSDVPLGAFLSGGIDSSTIVALMQEDRTDPIKTFTIGFEESEFDESSYAKAIAEHLHTDHTEFIVTAAEAQSVIPKLPSIYDEPFSDSSQIPTFLISRVASKYVTVSLSGDGGDEIFGGYNRYLWGPALWSQIKFIPRAIRPILASCVNLMPNQGWLGLESLVNKLNLGAGVESLNIKALKYSDALKTASSEGEFYKSFLTKWTDPQILIKGLDSRSDNKRKDENFSNLSDEFISSHDFLSRMMAQDSLHYLPDDILCKVDRAAMANSLETRVPFLDHRVLETAWRMPTSMKIRGSETKWALRQVLYKRVPQDLIDRPKTGFAVPVGEWLRGPLRDWAESLLSEANIDAGGYFYSEPIRIIWNQHLSRQHDWTDRIWSILMFQSWLEEN